MKRKKDKYLIYWWIGTLVSWILYYSGLVWVYTFLRRRLAKSGRKIILTFHRVTDNREEPAISVSLDNFNRQMSYLANRFKVVSLSSILSKQDCREDSLAITFDDGYLDNFTNALPILNKYNFTATVFLINGKIGAPGILNLAMIKAMQKQGISFASHTHSHKVLSKMDIANAEQEITGFKKILEDLLGEKIVYFSYPKGKARDFNQQIKEMVKCAGYQAAFTTENGAIGQNPDLFALPRIGIRDCPLFVFRARVSGIFESSLFYAFRRMLGLR